MDNTSPTRKDVAKLANVSVTVVSYVLNNNNYVAQEKRERVLNAIKQLNYKPNAVARALKGKKSNHILFIADNISNEHFGKIVEEMDRIAYDKGYLISLIADRNDSDFVAEIKARFVDGIVISSAGFNEEYVMQLIETKIPVVLLMNRDYPSVKNSASKIYTGLQLGMNKCVKLLIEKGRKNIIYIDRTSKSNRFSDMSDFRFKGFCDEMKKNGLTVDKNNVIKGYKNDQELYDGLTSRIRNGLIVDGIVGRNDNLACVAMSAVKDLGYNVPKDISVIGFDNSRLSSYVSPSLTSMEINRQGVAKAIITMLDEMIAGKSNSEQFFDTKLVMRNSI